MRQVVGRFKSFRRYVSDQQGSVTIVVTCMILALLSLTVTLAMLGQVFVQQRATESAADLSALAGAQNLIYGTPSACANARRVALLNATELVKCTCDATSVAVVVSQQVHSERIRAVLSTVTARSRAGY